MTTKVRRISANFDDMLQQMAASINETLPPEHQLSVLDLTSKLGNTGLASDITITIIEAKKSKRGRHSMRDIMDGL